MEVTQIKVQLIAQQILHIVELIDSEQAQVCATNQMVFNLKTLGKETIQEIKLQLSPLQPFLNEKSQVIPSLHPLVTIRLRKLVALTRKNHQTYTRPNLKIS